MLKFARSATHLDSHLYRKNRGFVIRRNDQASAKTVRYRLSGCPQRMIHIDQVCVEHADESSVTEP